MADTFINGQSRIPEVCGRLRTVMLECADWRQICQQHDGPDTLIYLDPPYVKQTRTANEGYVFEMSDTQHQELVDWCLGARSKILLSGYAHDLYNQLDLHGWERRMMPTVAHSSAARKKRGSDNGAERIECLWVNPAAQKQTTLFCGLDFKVHDSE